MIPGIRQLLTPLNYLRIDGGSVKKWYDVWIPLLVSVLVVSASWYFKWDTNLLNPKGIITQSTELLKMLIGFYIAALAAVSTFPGQNLDQNFSGSKMILTVRRMGKKKTKNLTRREFLSYLFGYLAFLSIWLFILGVVMQLAGPYFANLLSVEIKQYISRAVLMFYMFFICNLLVATLLGLHYLTDRIHRPEDGNVKQSEDKD